MQIIYSVSWKIHIFLKIRLKTSPPFFSTFQANFYTKIQKGKKNTASQKLKYSAWNLFTFEIYYTTSILMFHLEKSCHILQYVHVPQNTAEWIAIVSLAYLPLWAKKLKIEEATVEHSKMSHFDISRFEPASIIFYLSKHTRNIPYGPLGLGNRIYSSKFPIWRVFPVAKAKGIPEIACYPHATHMRVKTRESSDSSRHYVNI